MWVKRLFQTCHVFKVDESERMKKARYYKATVEVSVSQLE